MISFIKNRSSRPPSAADSRQPPRRGRNPRGWAGLPALALGAAICVVLAAPSGCGNEPDSLFDPTDASTGDGEGGSSGFNGSGDGGDGGDGASSACAATAAEAKLTPVNLVVMFDQSGSMGDTTEDPSFDPALRWIPVGAATKAFFADASSAGMNAALTFFPNVAGSCLSVDYATPEVTLSGLPSASFGIVIDAHAPKGDTPTRAAVAGAIAQGQALLTARPTEKTVIVLVTDGEPFGCGVATPAQQAAEVQRVVTDVSAVKATLPTYVIGVGPSVAALNAVATAGGTTAFQVQVGNPTQTTQQLLAAMAQIRGSVVQCDFDIPTPPDGRTLDLDKVNVEIVRPGQGPVTLPYDKDCTKSGWRFDPPAAPKKVQLCPAACNDVRASAGGKVNVVFACVPRPDVVR